MFILAPYEIDPATDVLRNTAEPGGAMEGWSSAIRYRVGYVVQTGTDPDVQVWRARYDIIPPKNANAGLPNLEITGRDPAGHNRVGYDNTGNLIVDPRLYPNVGETWWEDVSESAFLDNAVRMFNPDPGWATESPVGIQFDLKPSEPFDAVVLLGVSAAHLEIRVVNGPAAYSKRVTIKHDNPISPDYPNEPNVAYQIPLIDPAVHPSAYVSVSLMCAYDKRAAIAVLGSVIVGRALEIGRTLYGLEWELMDFSRYERDVFGHATVIRRGYSDRVTFPHVIESHEVTQARAIFTARRALPTVFIGSFEVPATIIYGYFQDLEQTYDSLAYNNASVVVESLLYGSPKSVPIENGSVFFFDSAGDACVENTLGSSLSLCLTEGALTDSAACTFLTPALVEGDTVEWMMTWTSGSSAIEPLIETLVTDCEQTLSVLLWPPSVPVAHEPGAAEIVAVITHADASQTTLGTAYLTVGCVNLGCTAAPLNPTWSDGLTTVIGYVRAPA